MVFDYSKLRGRIKELGLTEGAVAECIGYTPTGFGRILNLGTAMRADIIMALAELLQIEDIHEYFFALRV